MIDTKKTPFHPDEIDRIKAEKVSREQEVKDRLQKATDLGRKCLTQPDFVKYRENYEKLEKLLITAWIGLTEPDPMKYTVLARGMALQLHQLRLLLDSVKQDAERK